MWGVGAGAASVWVWVSEQASFVFFWGERALGWRLRQRLGVAAGDKGHGTGVVFENVRPRKAKLGFVNLCRLTC